jgi:tyrosinase
MPPFIRHEARSVTGALHVAAYADAVAAMQGRPGGTVTSWAYQAAMHGSTALPAQPLWNGCQHGAWFFVSWHRLYVYYFEKIVRAAVIQTGGPNDWALPYWNYGLNGINAAMPEAFRSPTRRDGTPNPLYVAARDPGINAGNAMPPQVTTAANALSRPQFVGATQFGGGIGGPAQFFGASGALELLPHNAVHGVIGGAGGWMGNVMRAAQDPIFWLHHSNIDRLWAVWRTATRGPTRRRGSISPSASSTRTPTRSPRPARLRSTPSRT